MKKKSGKIKPKKKTSEQLVLLQEQRNKDLDFYRGIWNTRKHECQICGTPLYGELKTIYFDHLLPKSKFENLRYESDNILIVCPTCHSLKEMGKPKEIHENAIKNAMKIFNT